MPQASDELRDRMHERFGNRIDDGGPAKFLEDRGWELTEGWEWNRPAPDHKITEAEAECIRFLIEEWDYGGVFRGE